MHYNYMFPQILFGRFVSQIMHSQPLSPNINSLLAYSESCIIFHKTVIKKLRFRLNHNVWEHKYPVVLNIFYISVRVLQACNKSRIMVGIPRLTNQF